MKYLSVCSGIEAATCAWHQLGFDPFAFAEIEKFPSQVLAHHYPQVPNFGDMSKFEEWPDATIDLLVGGTPCQSFSVAGLRKGLADPRGNLMLTYGAIARRYRPKWLVWENVPGVLSSNGGRDFGTFLGMLGQLGYGFAYRVLDAQYFGVAQRRRRVFVVGCLGDWRGAAAVLFERHSLQGHSAPSREARQTAPTIPARSTAGGGLGTDFDCDGGTICVATGQAGADMGADMAPTLNCNHEAPYVAYSLRGEGFDASEDGTGRGTPLVPVGVTIHGTDPTVQKVASYDELAQCLRARTPGNIDNSSTTVVQQPVAYGIRTANTSSNGWGIQEECTHTLDCAQGVAVAQPVAFDTTQITSAANYSNPKPGDPCHPLQAKAHVPAIAFPGRMSGTQCASSEEVAPSMCSVNPTAVAIGWSEELTAHHDLGATLQRGGAGGRHDGVMTTSMAVRRLTPEECEALQGFPRGYTLLPGNKADGPRYKALGNSMAVPVMAWIGRRIAEVDAVQREARDSA